MAQPSKVYRRRSRPSQTSAAPTPPPPPPPTENEPHKVIQITSREQFDNLLAEARNKIVLVEFFATWCGPCRTIAKQLDELAALYTDKALILKIDVDDHEEVALAYDVSSMPTFIIFQKKRKLQMFAGSNFEPVLKGMEKYCGLPEVPTDKEDEGEVGVPVTGDRAPPATAAGHPPPPPPPPPPARNSAGGRAKK